MGRGIEGKIEIFEQYVRGLKDLDGFSHIILLFHLHKSKGYSLEVVPYLDDKKRGLFATRAPRRPSPIGLSVVRLKRIEGNVIYIEDIDMLDGTPLLDIKPYVPAFDDPQDIRIGWLEGKAAETEGKKADGRF
jgi:tRNA-Thr(GGU) m(6)t(6)A37 methyltransferase TsaA